MLFSSGIALNAQQSNEPWTQDQLLAPGELANRLNTTSADKWPVIIAVNPDGMYGLPYKAGILGSTWFGPASEKSSLNKLKAYLKPLDRSKEIVLYCGCCPFNVCPNIRPAFDLLNELGFTNHYLLNIPKNIKENWINPGYPMIE
jgi:hypothetical protein